MRIGQVGRVHSLLVGELPLRQPRVDQPGGNLLAGQLPFMGIGQGGQIRRAATGKVAFFVWLSQSAV